MNFIVWAIFLNNMNLREQKTAAKEEWRCQRDTSRWREKKRDGGGGFEHKPPNLWV